AEPLPDRARKGRVPCPDRRKWKTGSASLGASGGGSDFRGYLHARDGRLGTDPTASQDATCQQDYCDLWRIRSEELSRHGEALGSPRHVDETVQCPRVAGCGVIATEMSRPARARPAQHHPERSRLTQDVPPSCKGGG